jgi:NADH:ubiquinone oxidoreductase subunit K
VIALSLQHFLVVGALLFALGVYAVLARRNAIAILMGVELMLNAANINFLAFWRFLGVRDLEGQVFVLIVITVAAAEAAVGLAIILNLYRNFRTINVESADTMKW